MGEIRYPSWEKLFWYWHGLFSLVKGKKMVEYSVGVLWLDHCAEPIES